MADSIQRIIPPSVALDRAGQFAKERRRKPEDQPDRQRDGGGENPVTANHPEPTAKTETESAQDKTKGTHVDINA